MRPKGITIWLWLKFYLVLEYRTETTYCANHCQCLRKPIVICSGRDLNYIPTMPSGTTVVVMNGTNLTHIGENGLVNLTDHSLRVLSLDANKITAWNNGADIFQNMTSLKRLILSNNQIDTVNESSFPPNILRSVDGIDLKSKKTCPPWNPLYTMAICITSFGIIMVTFIFVGVKCQTNIKNYIYLWRVQSSRKKGYIPLPEADNFEYHAFIVYCDADRSWVHETFLVKMEREEGVKLCIHHRDFDVGESITENIDKYLERSWKVLIIISNEFAKSEWCQWEVDLVQERRRKHGRDVVLLIMLESIDSKHMTRRLRTLLDSASPIMYQKGFGEVLFWKAVTKSLRKPLGDPPTSLL
ncbi:toll-like receptor 4 [Mytilus trossulus]|uniref:toll-like receptor 4 n=1 Tax=Mytilus trossulus TaxID=6551 RepID=UPI003004D208